MAASVRIYFKKELRLDRLTFPQRAMATIGFAADRLIKERTRRGIGPTDAPSPPLSKRWRRIKLSRGLKPIRDLRGPGWGVWLGPKQILSGKGKGKFRRKVGRLSKPFHLLDEQGVRTVTENRAVIGFPTEAARLKAIGNWNREQFLKLSPKNLQQLRPIVAAALQTAAQKMVKVISIFRKAA